MEGHSVPPAPPSSPQIGTAFLVHDVTSKTVEQARQKLMMQFPISSDDRTIVAVDEVGPTLQNSAYPNRLRT